MAVKYSARSLLPQRCRKRLNATVSNRVSCPVVTGSPLA